MHQGTRRKNAGKDWREPLTLLYSEVAEQCARGTVNPVRPGREQP